jgi:hypothetical protein
MEGWYSTKCRLTWKLKGTKCNRFYFQLAPSTLPTEGIEFGSAPSEMLPTPKAMEAPSSTHQRKPDSKYKPGDTLTDKMIKGMLPTPTTDSVSTRTKRYSQGGLPLSMAVKMLPTPIASDCMSGGTGQTEYAKKHSSDKLKYAAVAGLLPTPTAVELYKAAKGNHQDSLTRRVKRGEFLPTPTSSCQNAGTAVERRDGVSRASELNHLVSQQAGKSSHLNPPFVAEMMGFPVDWTVLPFQSGETKA